jgi:hypothetical protein
MDAALSIAAARGCDLAVISELLPAAEAGLVEGVVSAATIQVGSHRDGPLPSWVHPGIRR